MGNLATLPLETEQFPDWIAACVAVFALAVSLGVAIRQEILALRQLRIQRDSDLLVWGHESVDAIQNMILYVESGKFQATDSESSYERFALLAHCSALIDRGRWFLPNIEDRGGKFGQEKQRAYRGFRQIGLDSMVYSYDHFKRHANDKTKSDAALIDFLTTAKRELVSEIQFTVSPQRIQKILGDKPNYPKWMHDK
jgi:hypothetical protein